MTDVRYAIERDADRTGSTVNLRLTGRFDRSAHRELRREIGAVLGRRAVSVVIDMRGVDFIGTECLALLLVGYTRALRAGHGYQVKRGRGHVRRVLEDTGLSAAAEPRAATAARAGTAPADADADVSWLDLLVDPSGFVKQGPAPRAAAGGEELRPL